MLKNVKRDNRDVPVLIECDTGFGRNGVQTPQAFLIAPLRAAHAANDEDAPDDAMLLERAGEAIAWVEGEPDNLKITYPDDLRVMEAMVR